MKRILHRCKKCGKTKQIPVIEEYGRWDIDPEYEEAEFNICCEMEMEVEAN